jgi:DnaJ-related protein SCJ1
MFGKVTDDNSFHDPFDIFSQFGFQRQERKGADIELQLDVTLKQLYLGHTYQMDINRQVICSSCRGSGAKSSSHIHTCTTCGGSGVRIVSQQIAPGFHQRYQTEFFTLI